jgi:flagellar hook assembly protein FlgD
MNLMTLLSSKTNIAKLKNIEELTIKTVQNPSKLQVSYDKIVYTSPMKISINNYESLTISIFILDLKGNLVKILAENKTLQSGNTEIDWDLTGRFGSDVPNGHYILYIISNGEKVAKLFGVKR